MSEEIENWGQTKTDSELPTNRQRQRKRKSKKIKRKEKKKGKKKEQEKRQKEKEEEKKQFQKETKTLRKKQKKKEKKKMKKTKKKKKKRKREKEKEASKGHSPRRLKTLSCSEEMMLQEIVKQFRTKNHIFTTQEIQKLMKIWKNESGIVKSEKWRNLKKTKTPNEKQFLTNNIETNEEKCWNMKKN